ncbi:DUF3667 domain-containing protein [Maribacter sp. 2210JD10-5]|uniref:DUF3667 domain-containing protein n=1 Tax=Maribacter sp. 2210JD10-5 TaxID=3386272 RepID=UPI0039BD8380
METKPQVNTSGRYKLQYRGVECLNCKHPLDISDKYCPNCAQANSTKKLSLKDFIDEFFSNVISYDSKLLKTLGALLLRPGRITRDYIEGKRVSYTNPFRFLLSLSIIYFLLMGFSGDFDRLDRFADTATDDILNFEAEDVIQNLDSLEQKEARGILNQLDSLKIGKFISDQARKKDSMILADPKKELEKLSDKNFFGRHLGKQKVFRLLIERDTAYIFDDIVQKHGIKNSRENRMSFSSTKSLIKVQRQPGEYVSSLISKLPFTTFFLLPVFTVFIWLIYIRKKYTYTDHLIFSFHNQSLLFILLIISYLIDTIFGVGSGGIFLLIFGIYLYKAMRNYYEQGRFKTIVKYLFLNTIFIILAIIGVVILFTASIFTY